MLIYSFLVFFSMKKQNVNLCYRGIIYPLDVVHDYLVNIVIGVAPFVVIFEYNIEGDKDIVDFFSEKNLSDIEKCEANGFGCKIKVENGELYFNEKKIEEYIKDHRLEGIVT